MEKVGDIREVENCTFIHVHMSVILKQKTKTPKYTWNFLFMFTLFLLCQKEN